MTVVSLTAIHPKPGAKWEDTKKHLKKGCDLARKHGAENVTALVGIAAGTATGTVILVYSCADWASYGKYQNAMMADPRDGDPDGRSERSDRQLGHVPQPDDPGHVTRLQTLPERGHPSRRFRTGAVVQGSSHPDLRCRRRRQRCAHWLLGIRVPTAPADVSLRRNITCNKEIDQIAIFIRCPA